MRDDDGVVSALGREEMDVDVDGGRIVNDDDDDAEADTTVVVATAAAAVVSFPLFGDTAL